MTPREQGFVTDEYADEMADIHTELVDIHTELDICERRMQLPPEVTMRILVQMHDQMCKLIARIQKLEENKE